MTCEAKTVLILRESVAHSLAKDAGTLAMNVAIIGIGWWLDSAAMQWLGFVMICVRALARANMMKAYRTPQEAADRLYEKFGVSAKGERRP